MLQTTDSKPYSWGMAIDIETNAGKPAKVSGDAGSVEQHRLSDQIEADKYVASKAASIKRGTIGIKLVKLIPCGTVDTTTIPD